MFTAILYSTIVCLNGIISVRLYIFFVACIPLTSVLLSSATHALSVLLGNVHWNKMCGTKSKNRNLTMTPILV